MGEKWPNLPFLGKTPVLVLVPKVGTGTYGQRPSGTGTDQSGTGTDALCSPDYCTFVLLSPRFVHR